FQRNIGVFTREQQELLRGATVSIAGLGGIGGLLAERVARLGVGRLSIADPEVFEPQNRNRQLLATSDTEGKNKTLVAAEHLRDVNPGIELRIFPEGIQPGNIAEFADSDVIVNAIEFNLPSLSVLLSREAERLGRHVVAAQVVGFGATLVVFKPGGVTFEDYLGVPDNVDDDWIPPFEKFVPSLPAYADEVLVADVVARACPIPSTSIGAMMAASLAAMAIVAILLGLEVPGVPDVISLDPYDILGLQPS
ncbi:MAG: ThiF family adenylyltransferase, partial [Coriobacteriia bacterium]